MTLERLRELSGAMSRLQQELAAIAKEHAQEMLDELKAGFASLPDPGCFAIEGRVARSVHISWEFREHEVLHFRVSDPFDRYKVCTEELRLVAEFDSLPKMVKAVCSWASRAINFALSTQEILDATKGFQLERIYVGRKDFGEGAPGFSALYLFSPGELCESRVDRAIEIAIGPFDLECQKGFHALRGGEVSILLTRREYGEERVAPYSFTSTEEAIAWLSEHLDDLSNPEEFDAACKE